MLQVLNARERNQAFLKFFVFFLVTITLIICAAYVDFRGLPEARRKYLEGKFEGQRTEMQAQQEFVLQMEKARKLLDSLAGNVQTQAQVDILLTGKLSDLERIRPKDSTLNGKLDAVILESFLELKELKKERSKLIELASKARELEQNYNNCQLTLDACRARLQGTPVMN